MGLASASPGRGTLAAGEPRAADLLCVKFRPNSAPRQKHDHHKGVVVVVCRCSMQINPHPKLEALLAHASHLHHALCYLGWKVIRNVHSSAHGLNTVWSSGCVFFLFTGRLNTNVSEVHESCVHVCMFAGHGTYPLTALLT